MPYTGKLTDLGLGVLAPYFPILRVRPEREAMSVYGLVSAVPVTVPVNAVTGEFSFDAIPSGELTPPVDYILEVGRFEESIDGHRFVGHDQWRFTAVAGGGNVGQMQGGSLLSVWIGPPWPSEPLPKGLYLDTTGLNPFGIVS